MQVTQAAHLNLMATPGSALTSDLARKAFQPPPESPQRTPVRDGQLISDLTRVSAARQPEAAGHAVAVDGRLNTDLSTVSFSAKPEPSGLLGRLLAKIGEWTGRPPEESSPGLGSRLEAVMFNPQPEPPRPLFFDGRLLNAQDLARDQTY
ncbi:MAG: hypothetical protein AAF628_13885 [Planctomycetota bacterium]